MELKWRCFRCDSPSPYKYQLCDWCWKMTVYPIFQRVAAAKGAGTDPQQLERVVTEYVERVKAALLTKPDLVSTWEDRLPAQATTTVIYPPPA